MNTETSSNIRPELVEFIRQKPGEVDLKRSKESQVEETFGMAELDTIVFYNDFVEQFNSSVPSNWDIRKHDSPVVFHNWRHYIQRLFSNTYRAQTNYRDLTIRELEVMIGTKAWAVNE